MAPAGPSPTSSRVQASSGGLGSFRLRSGLLPARLLFSGHTRVSPALFGALRRRSALSVTLVACPFRRPSSARLGRVPPLLGANTNDPSLWAGPLQRQAAARGPRGPTRSVGSRVAKAGHVGGAGRRPPVRELSRRRGRGRAGCLTAGEPGKVPGLRERMAEAAAAPHWTHLPPLQSRGQSSKEESHRVSVARTWRRASV